MGGFAHPGEEGIVNGLDLPTGYRLCYDADYVELLAPNGKIVDRFMPSVRGQELVRAAEEHRSRVDARIAEVEHLLARRRGKGRS